MRTKMKRFFGVILSTTLILGLMPWMSTQVFADEITTDPVIGTGSLEGANVSRNLATDTSGGIHIVFKNAEGKIIYRKSTNGGSTFTDSVEVAEGSECEVAVSSTGRVFVSYYASDGNYIAYSDNGTSFTTVKLEQATYTPSEEEIQNYGYEMYETDNLTEEQRERVIADLIMMNSMRPGSMHIATDGNHVYGIDRSGTSLFYSSNGGVTYNSHSGWSGYAYSDVQVDTANHNVIVLKDNPSVVCRVSSDYGVTFTEEVPVECDGNQIQVYYSTATVGAGCAYMSGSQNNLYKIDYHNATAIKVDVNASRTDMGRSLSADEDGNVVVGYVGEDGNKVCYQLSTNGGNWFSEGVAAAEAQAANAAINITTGDVLFLYEKDGKVMLHTESGVITGAVNYQNETIDGLEPNTEYKVEVLGENEQATATYYIISDENGKIPFVGNDKNEQPYGDLTGKKIKITKVSDSEISETLEIASRPGADDPDQLNVVKPQEVDSNEVIVTDNSITIKPTTVLKQSQMYRLYDQNGATIEGRDWTEIGEDGTVSFTGLNGNTTYVIKSYIPATDSAPKSLESEGLSVTTRTPVSVTEPEPESKVIAYDAKEHIFKINVTPNDAVVKYSLHLNEEYSLDTVSLKRPGVYTVYYKATKDLYTTVYGSFVVEITGEIEEFTLTDSQKPTVKAEDEAIYTGSTLVLVNAPVDALPEGYTMKYALGTSAETEPSGEAFATTIPTATNAGTYYVWYKVVDDENIDVTDAVCLSSTIYPGSSPTEPQTEKSLIYSGEAQELVTPGTAEGGTIVYALGTDTTTAPTDDKYSTSIPKGTEPGTYYVWYKVRGDEGHLDSEPACIIVTITEVNADTDSKIEPLPEGKTSSLDTSTKPSVSNGLANEARALATTTGDNVELNLVVTPSGQENVAESTLLQNDEQMYNSVISQYKDEESVSVDVLDISIKRRVNGSDAPNVRETSEVLEIGIAYNFTGKYDPRVVRRHGTETHVFRLLSSKPTNGFRDGTFFVNREANMLYIYSDKFSDYVVAYSTVEGNAREEAVVSSVSSGSTSSVSSPKTVPVYRLFNKNSGAHLFTANKEERDTVLAKNASGWTDEGIAFQTAIKSNTPVYRVFDLKKGTHIYVSDVTARDAYLAKGMRDEGIAWYAVDKAGRKVNKILIPQNGDLLYTTSKAEADDLVNAGFTCEVAEFVVY